MSGHHSKNKLLPYRYCEWEVHPVSSTSCQEDGEGVHPTFTPSGKVASRDSPTQAHRTWLHQGYYAFVHFLSDSNPLLGIDRNLDVSPTLRRSDPTTTSSTSSSKTVSETKKFRSAKAKVQGIDANNKFRSGTNNKHNRPGTNKKNITGLQRTSNKKRKKSIAGHPSYRLYLDSGASVHILFCRELMGKLHQLKEPLNISGVGGKPSNLRNTHLYIKHSNTFYQEYDQ